MFVIYLSNEDNIRDFPNGYGYYSGKTYTLAKEVFPHCDHKISSRTKFYKSRKVAENSAKSIADKCAYVTSYRVEESDWR